METIKAQVIQLRNVNSKSNNSKLQTILTMVFVLLLVSFSASAHCDSYDGPVITDAVKALETNNVDFVLKWITEEQEEEIIQLFNKTFELKKGDKEIYAIVEKHFFETLVRLHRETEGEPYTGLKPAGSTKQIIQMTDEALKEGHVDDFLVKLNAHIDRVVREKYKKVITLNKVKDNSAQQGRAFVEAYVDYTHTVASMHDIMENGPKHDK